MIHSKHEIKRIDLLHDAEDMDRIRILYEAHKTDASAIRQEYIGFGTTGYRVRTTITWPPGSYVNANRLDWALRDLMAGTPCP